MINNKHKRKLSDTDIEKKEKSSNVQKNREMQGAQPLLSYRLLYKPTREMQHYIGIEPGSSPDGSEDYPAIITCSINKQYNTITFTDGEPENSKIRLFNLCDDTYILNLQKDQTHSVIQQIKQKILNSNINIISDLCQIIAEYSVDLYKKWQTIEEYSGTTSLYNIEWDREIDEEMTESEEEDYWSFHDDDEYEGILKLSDEITMNLYHYYHGDVRVKSITMPLPDIDI